MLLSTREVTFPETKKKTSEIHRIYQFDYLPFFTFEGCNYCKIDDYVLDNFDSTSQDTAINDGTISITMGTQDISTKFDIVPQFNDNECERLFVPSSLKVTLDIEHECGNEEDSI